MSFLTGGSKQKSQNTSSSTSLSQGLGFNRAYDDLKTTLGTIPQFTQTAGNSLMELLGLGSGGGGYDQYKNDAGFNFGQQEGGRGILANAGARRMLQSGGVGKSLQRFGEGYNQQFFGDYLSKILGLAGLGLQGSGVLAGAGGVNTNASSSFSNSQGTSSGSSSPGLGSLIGAAASAAAGGF